MERYGEAAGLFGGLKALMERLAAIERAQAVLASEPDPDVILEKLVEEASKIINAETLAVSQLSDDRQSVSYGFCRGKHADTLKDVQLPVSNSGLCGWVLENRKPILSVDLLDDPRVIKDSALALGVHTALVTPLIARGQIIGGLSAFNKNDGSKFEEEDLSALMQLSGYAALAVANASAEKRLENQKDEFISMLSHDLKTPLTSIKGYAELVDQEDDSGAMKELNRVILKNAEMVLRLINEMLEYSRAGSGRLSLDRAEIAMKPFLGLTLERFVPMAAERGVSLSWQAEEAMREAYADLDLMTRIISNLLTNALEHARPGGAVRVSASDGPGGFVAIEVEDDGPGIKPEYLPRIFDKYYSRGKGPHEGFGLGLYIAKTLCELHGGSVSAESEEGMGTRFRVLLPSADCAKEA